MLQAGHSSTFMEKALELLGAGIPRQDHFQGDQTIELQVPRLVDDAHAAVTENAEQFIARNLRKNQAFFE
jgi:hypothetical protein